MPLVMPKSEKRNFGWRIRGGQYKQNTEFFVTTSLGDDENTAGNVAGDAVDVASDHGVDRWGTGGHAPPLLAGRQHRNPPQLLTA